MNSPEIKQKTQEKTKRNASEYISQMARILVSKEMRDETKLYKSQVKQENRRRKEAKEKQESFRMHRELVSDHMALAEKIKINVAEKGKDLVSFRAWDEPKAMKNLAMITVESLTNPEATLITEFTKKPDNIRASVEGEKFWGKGEYVIDGENKKVRGRLYTSANDTEDYNVGLVITSGTRGRVSSAFLLINNAENGADFSELAQEIAEEQYEKDQRRDYSNIIEVA